MRRKKANPLIRSVLFCPTDKVSLIEKALGVGINSSHIVVLDLEDLVSPVMKEKARENIIQVMNNINDSHRRKIPKTNVRVNCGLGHR